jgi:putative tryptophan/tyrosine transport system substrate-binding protein
MKRIIPLIIGALLLLAGSDAAASEIVVLQSSRLLPYEQARQRLEQSLTERPLLRGVKSILPDELDHFVLSEEPDFRHLRQNIANGKPRLLVAIGSNALAVAGDFPAIPIVYLLVPEPEPLISRHGSATGVSMTMPLTVQLKEMTRVLPKVGRLGVIHDPRSTGGIIAEARKAAAGAGLELIIAEAGNPREVPALLDRLRGKVDAYWLLPDLTVLTPRIIEEILLFSIRNDIPVLSFSEKYLEAGAALAITYDAADMGEKAAELSREILQGADAGRMAPVQPDRVSIAINQKILRKMGIPFKPTATAVSGRNEAR